MDEFKKYVNLIWKVPVAVLFGGVGYVLTKTVAVTLLTNYSIYLNPRDITTIGTLVPLIVPLGCLVWAFGDFIFPPKPPEEPPMRGGFPR